VHLTVLDTVADQLLACRVNLVAVEAVLSDRFMHSCPVFLQLLF
jgi:hypothetical protein